MSDVPPRRPFAPALGVLFVVILIVVGAPMVAGVVIASIYQQGFNAAVVGVVVAGTLVAALLVALWWARRWATRNRQGRPTPVGNDPAVVPGRVWRVTEPGIALLDSPWGVSVATRLLPGTQLVEADRYGERLQVTTPDGSTGWVDARLLASPLPHGDADAQEQQDPEVPNR